MISRDDLERRLASEIANREEAERLLEVKSRELFSKTQHLRLSSLDLLEHVELISTIIDVVPHIVLTCNEGLIIEMANCAAARLLGYEPKHLIGRHVDELLPSYGRYRRKLEMETFLIPELAVRTSDGNLIHGELRGRRTKVKNKPFIVMVISDNSAHKAAEALKQKIYQQLYESRRLEAIGTLSSGNRPDRDQRQRARHSQRLTGEDLRSVLHDQTGSARAPDKASPWPRISSSSSMAASCCSKTRPAFRQVL